MKVLAKQLATGDSVGFPKLGLLRIVRMTAANNLAVSFVFEDGKQRTLENDKPIFADLAKDAPAASCDEIYRKDLATGRISVISLYSLRLFADVSRSYKALRGRVQEFDDQAARGELLHGARLFTNAAEYWMSSAKPESRERYVPLLKDISCFEWQGH